MDNKKKSWKLVADPALKTGPQKVYRTEGIVPGVSTLFDPVSFSSNTHRVTGVTI